MAVMASISFGISAQTIQHYCLDVKDFVELKVVDGINVDYVCNPDSAGMAVFDAPADMTSRIMFAPKDGKLTIQLDNADQPEAANIPRVTVYSRYLSLIENDGDSLVRALRVAPGPKLKARVVGNGRMSLRGVDVNELQASIATGNGSIVVDGRCDVAKLYVTGSGTISADELTARKANCRIAGTGNIGCSPSEELSLKGAGTGKVYYHGDPSIKNVSLGLSMEKIP